MDGWYYVEGIIWDDKAQELINKGWSVSCSYDYLAFNDEGGDENNIHYDKEFTQLNFTHLAIVDNPRYERANIVFNSKVDNENKNHYPKDMPNGKGGQFAPKEYEKYFTDKTTGMSMYDDVLFDDHYAETKQRFPKVITISPQKYIDTVADGFDKMHVKYDDNPIRVTSEELVKSRTDEKLNKLREKFGKEPFDMPMIGYEMQKDRSTDMAFQEGIHRAILAKEAGLKEIPVAIYSTGRYGEKFTNEELKDNLDKVIKNLFNNKTNNAKEIEMNIIDKLQELINSVKNNKENETMVENEKVDKRKLIDEVAGIMKSAGCDDEDIRTAIGKMEKIGYDDSETSADNKKVKNEADEEDKKVDNEEDEKEEDKKVDNEDDKDEDKKEDKVDNESDEDKEKAEDLKEEEKKDVDNKCKNSKEESYFDKINKIYNSAKKIEEPSVEYESKQARLDAGKEYFG